MLATSIEISKSTTVSKWSYENIIRYTENFVFVFLSANADYEDKLKKND